MAGSPGSSISRPNEIIETSTITGTMSRTRRRAYTHMTALSLFRDGLTTASAWPVGPRVPGALPLIVVGSGFGVQAGAEAGGFGLRLIPSMPQGRLFDGAQK